MDPNLGYVTPPPKETFRPSRKVMMIGAGILIALVTSIGLLLASSGSGTGKQMQHLVVRLNNLQVYLTDQQTVRNLKNPELTNLATSFGLTVTSDIQNLSTTLAAEYPAKIDKNIEASESDALTAQNIEEAYLKNDLDRVYSDVLDKKIASIRALMAEIYGKTKSQKLKTALVEIDKHMKTASDQIEDLKL